MENLNFVLLAGLIAALASVCSIASFYAGRKNAAKLEGREDGSLATELKYMRESMQGMKESIDSLSRKVASTDEKREGEFREMLVAYTKNNESVKSLHKRVDFLYDKLNIPRGAE